jgi:tetratricopeptide (TPR) repeat protein
MTAAERETGATTGRHVRGWTWAALLALLVIVAVIPLHALRQRGAPPAADGAAGPPATFVGHAACIDCHREAYETWRGSHHDHAMAIADSTTVLGDFDDAVFEDGGIRSRFYRRDGRYFVHTEGPGGVMDDFEIAYTFGVEPLQQYLIPFPGGRLQSLTIAWDTARERWFHLYPHHDIPPDDWLHWTRGGQNWNGMCAECHSTNLRKGYDPESDTFDTRWSEIDVSCEACHGPGSRHVEWAEIEPMGRPAIDDYGLVVRTGGISSRQQVELCAPCHSRRTELGDYDHSGGQLMDSQLPELLSEGLYYADGQILEEVYVYGSFVQSKMYHNDVRCSDCHHVHSLELLAAGNDLCTRCHRADVYDSYDHHFHQQVVDGKPSPGAKCVRCHMPERAYMVIDERADHSLRAPRPDLTVEIGTPNACAQAGCHDDRTAEWAAEAFRDWYGKAKKPHYGRILAAARAGEPGVRDELVRLTGDPLYPAIVRATALSLLVGYEGEEVTRALDAALADEDPLLRHTALSSLRPLDPTETAARIAPLLFDPVKAVRLQAAYELSALPIEQLKPYQREAWGRALVEYEQAMTYSLDFAHAGHNLGSLYANLGNPGRAELLYRQAIAVDDLFYPAKMNLAMLLNQQGRNDEAAELIGAVVRDHPELHEAEYSLALLLVEMGRHAEALPHLERAARGLPERSRVHYNLGLLEQQQGRDAAAETALRHALELEPDRLEYLYALADYYFKRRRLDEAQEMARRMIAAHPEARVGHDLMAHIESARRGRAPAPADRER